MAATLGRHWSTDRFRTKIKAGMLRKRLQDHALGNVEMSATQIRAAEILLKKAVPGLTAVEHSGEVSHRQVSELSRDELLAIAAGSRAGASEAGSGEPEPNPVH